MVSSWQTNKLEELLGYLIDDSLKRNHPSLLIKLVTMGITLLMITHVALQPTSLALFHTILAAFDHTLQEAQQKHHPHLFHLFWPLAKDF